MNSKILLLVHYTTKPPYQMSSWSKLFSEKCAYKMVAAPAFPAKRTLIFWLIARACPCKGSRRL